MANLKKYRIDCIDKKEGDSVTFSASWLLVATAEQHGTGGTRLVRSRYQEVTYPHILLEIIPSSATI